MKKTYYRVSEAASLLQVSASTLRKYTEQGLIECSRNHAGQRVYTPEQIKNFLGEALDTQISNKKVVFYIRASDGSQARLKTQTELLKEEFGEPLRVFQDKASGLNENRAGLNSLLNRAKKKEFDFVAITAKDRLTRFGFAYLERLLGDNGIEILVLDNHEAHKETLEEKLMKDFMSLIASFSGKFYRLRGNEQKRKLIDAARKRIIDE